MPPGTWWFLAITPPQPARPVHDIPPVITPHSGWRGWLARRRCL